VHLSNHKVLLSIYAVFRWYCPYDKTKTGKPCYAKYRANRLPQSSPASTLVHHLNRNHPKWREDLEDNKDNEKVNSVQKRQRTLDGETKKHRQTSDASKDLSLVLKDFIESNTSFRAVERPTKLEILRRAKLPTPSRRTLAREMKKHASTERGKLFSQVRQADCVVLCIDLWTSNSREDFLSILAFFIDSGMCICIYIFLISHFLTLSPPRFSFKCSVAVPVCSNRF
jgi:hypothetical protein